MNVQKNNISHYISHYFTFLFALLIVLLGWFRTDQPTKTTAADDISVIESGPERTQDFFAPFGDATVQRGADGQWSQVILTPAMTNKAGAVTLNNRLDFSRDFTLQYSALLGNGKGDGMSFALYPGQIGAVGMFGGNLGVAGLPNAIGFKIDTYPNDNGNIVGRGPTIWNFAQFAVGQGFSFDRTIDPDTRTREYADQMRKVNQAGAVWGNTEVDLGQTTPYGSFIETNGYGYLSTMTKSNPHQFLGLPMGTQLQNSPPSVKAVGGQVNNGPALINTNGNNLTDGQWHGIRIGYVVQGDTGTMTVGLYKDPNNFASTPLQTWSTQVNVRDIQDKTNGKPYFALNIAGSNGLSAASQAVKNIYIKYTPEPGGFTTRYIDENGTSIKTTENKGDSTTLDQDFTQTIDRVITNKATGETFTFDYATLENYSKPGIRTKLNFDKDDGKSQLTYTGKFLNTYQRLNVVYRKSSNFPATSWSITGGGKTETSKQPDNQLTVAQNNEVTYTYNIALDTLAPNPWTGVKLTTMIPAGLNYSNASLVLQNGSTQTSTAPLISNVQQADGRSLLTFQSVDLYGTGTSTQPNNAQIQLKFMPSIPLIGTIETSAHDTYKENTSDTPKETSYWTSQPATTVTKLQITGTQGISKTAIPMPDRASKTVAIEQNQLFLPPNVTQITSAKWWALPGGLQSDDITIASPGENLPFVLPELTDKGQKKLTGNDSVHVGILFSGKTGDGRTFDWVVDYELFEPLTTWMPDTGLVQTVATQVGLTNSETLQKSTVRDKLTSFAGDVSLWTILQDPTGLEYAANLKTFNAPGNANADVQKAPGSFRRFLTMLATDRGQGGTPSKVLESLNLSGYPVKTFAPDSSTPVGQSLPTFASLTGFTAVNDGLTANQFTDTSSSDLVPFITQQQGAKLKTINIAADEPAAGTANANNILPVLTGLGDVTVQQTNMIDQNAVELKLAPAQNDPNKLIISPSDGKDVRQKLAAYDVGIGKSVALSADDVAKTQVAFFDQGSSKTSATNNELTNWIDSTNPGLLNMNYQDYLSNSRQKTGQGYLRLSLTKGTTNYSLWLPAVIKGTTYLTVTGTLDFGHRRLAPGNYANNGHDDMVAPDSDPNTGKPITITTLHKPNDRVVVTASPFTGGPSTVDTFALTFGQGGVQHKVPANSLNGTNGVVFPELTPNASLLTTQQYSATLNVPEITGILSGQHYESTVTYSLTRGV